MDLDEFVEVFACMISADGHKWDAVLGHRNVALFQFSPCFWVVNLECMHVCYVSWPESLVLDPIHCKEQLAERFSSFKMKVKISIPRCCYKVENRLRPVQVVHHGTEHCVLGLLFFPIMQPLHHILLSQRLQ